MSYKISTIWDDAAGVWVATSSDIPGLCLESGSFDALIEKVKFAIPELLELNSEKTETPFTVDFSLTRKEEVAVYG